MRKQDKTTTLCELINSSEIYQSLELLKDVLHVYQQQNNKNYCGYAILHEFAHMRFKLADFENQLKELTRLSETWETLS